MEIVLNFDKKELVIKEKANVKELYKRLEKLLGKDIGEWDVVSDVVYKDNNWWYYQPYRYHPWPSVDWIDSTVTYTVGDEKLASSGVYCISDNMSAVSPDSVGDVAPTNREV